MPSYPARLEGPHVRNGRGPVVDGDSLLVKRLLASDERDWEIVEGGVVVRLLSVDTPETNRLATREMGLHFAAFTRSWLEARMASGDSWPLTLDATFRDSFGRWLANILDARTGESLSDALIAEGDRIGVDVRYPGGVAAQIMEARGE